ncbi:MAG: carbohydrate ABC transporter permease [Rhodospirillaceae bacterium]|jgi:multiple sugar transport system permease protein|nr:carbohydrate ABC transporter permease [Rhodospirillaceae bacterium]
MMIAQLSALDRAKDWLEERRLTWIDLPIWLLGMGIAVLWALPFVWMVSTSFKFPQDVMTADIQWLPQRVTWDNYLKVFEYPVLRWGINSVIQASVSTILCVLAGAMAGYALARMRFPGRGLIFGIFLASLMIPVEVSVIPMLLGMIKIGWASSYQALILPTVGNVFSVYIFRQFFLTFPSELEEAARMDGAGHFRLFWLIALPLARAPMIAAFVIIFTLNWNNFLWPLLVTFDESMKTLPVGIAAFTPVVGTHTQLEGYSVAMAGVTVLSLPSLILFFVLQRYFIQGISQGSLKQ